MKFLEVEKDIVLSAVEQEALERNLQQIHNSLVQRGIGMEEAHLATSRLAKHSVEMTKEVGPIRTRAGFSFIVSQDGGVEVKNRC